MSNNTEISNELSLAEVLRQELKHIKPNSNTSSEDLSEIFEEFYNTNFSALCLSGGGIRSATFALGIVQALAKHKLMDKFDYLSTVSGGGYLGAWLSAWVRREQIRISEAKQNKEEDVFKDYQECKSEGINVVQEKLNNRKFSTTTCPNPEPEQLQHLRRYSNYMSPKVGLLSADTWTLLGIYIRNLFLNWMIFIPLIAAFLLIPRILFASISLNNLIKISDYILVIGLIAGSLAFAFAVNKFPSKNPDSSSGKINTNTDGWVLALGILPLVICAFTATSYWAWFKSGKISDFSLLRSFSLLPSFIDKNTIAIILFTVLIYLLGYLFFFIYRFFSKGKLSEAFDWRGFIAAVFSSLVGGFLMWLAANNIFTFISLFKLIETNKLALYFCVAVPLFLLIILITSAIFVGLSSRFVTDDDREWLARQGAWILIICFAWLALNFMILFGPLGLIKSTKLLFSSEGWTLFFNSLFPIIAVISGILSLGGGFSGKSLVRNEPSRNRLSKFLKVAPRIASVIFLGFLLIGLAYILSVVICAVSGLENINEVKFGNLFEWFCCLIAIGIFMASFVNINKFSLHGAYRNRLSRAYLGASRTDRKGNTFTGFDDKDNFQLHRLKGQKPFHILSATLNLIGGKNLAWQNRKAASFTMSPLHCGSWLVGYCHTNKYSRSTTAGECENIKYCNQFGEEEFCKTTDNCRMPGKSIRLGTAMAISGAAANPNMGYYSSSVVTFLMTLFNIRLGWWLGNPGKIGNKTDIYGRKYFEKSSPTIAVLPLLNETFGRTDENKRFVNITDGGHFENLGLYEMVLRRCRYIVLSDAAADQAFTFSEISNAIEKCKVDLGVDIEFNNGINIYDRIKAKDCEDTRKRFAIAEIIYPEKDSNGAHYKGLLLYTRPTFYGTESTEIRHYANSNPTFPHQSTSDQLFDERQFEAYRALGFFTMEEIIGKQKLDNLSELIEILHSKDKKQID